MRIFANDGECLKNKIIDINTDLESYLISKFRDKNKLSEILDEELKNFKNSKSFAKINYIIPFIEKAGIKKVVFVSSTSVYSDENKLVTEETIANPDTESGKQLVACEQLLQNNSNFETTALRFGGLIGEDRNPIRFLAGRNNIENPNAPINLIHQEDCIGIILKIIESNCWGETFNAVAPFHPSREAYYTQTAKEYDLELPIFAASKPSIGKTILSDKLEKVLNYQFIKDSL